MRVLRLGDGRPGPNGMRHFGAILDGIEGMIVHK